MKIKTIIQVEGYPDIEGSFNINDHDEIDIMSDVAFACANDTVEAIAREYLTIVLSGVVSNDLTTNFVNTLLPEYLPKFEAIRYYKK